MFFTGAPFSKGYFGTGDSESSVFFGSNFFVHEHVCKRGTTILLTNVARTANFRDSPGIALRPKTGIFDLSTVPEGSTWIKEAWQFNNMVEFDTLQELVDATNSQTTKFHNYTAKARLVSFTPGVKYVEYICDDEACQAILKPNNTGILDECTKDHVQNATGDLCPEYRGRLQFAGLDQSDQNIFQV